MFKRLTMAAAAALIALPAFAAELMQPKDVAAGVASGQITLVDIRTPAEWAETGVAAEATPLDMTSPQFIDGLKKVLNDNPGKKLALICRSGNRSGQMAAMLEQAGLSNVVDVAGGMAGKGANPGWIAAGLPLRKL